MKANLGLILVSSMVFGLAACNPSASKKQSVETGTAPEEMAPLAKDGKTLLQLGNEAFLAGRYTTPVEDNALHWFVEARQAGVDLRRVETALADLAPLARGEILAQIKTGDFAAARASIALLALGLPDSILAKSLSTELDTAQRAQALALASKNPNERDASLTATTMRMNAAQESSDQALLSGKSQPTETMRVSEVQPIAASATRLIDKSTKADVETPSASRNLLADDSVEKNGEALQRLSAVAAPASHGQALNGTAANDLASNVTTPRAKPSLLEKFDPQYPSRARQQKIEGWVALEYTVTEEGRVRDITVVESAPSNVFNSAAVRALTRWKYKPATDSTGPKNSRIRTTINFKLS